ncbi:hypothetical protein H0H93_001199 [Arthromyces matolae]|nr:hypothetical protein H0H93_001199 [Arthromyces matolae]
MAKKTKGGVSRVVDRVRASSKVSYGMKKARLKHEALNRERDLTRIRYMENIAGLSASSISALEDSIDDHNMNLGGNEWEDVENIVGSEINPEDVDVDCPETSIIYDLRELTTSKWNTRHYVDHRTWKLRRETLEKNWAPLLEPLTDAYLQWRYQQQSSQQPPPSESNPYDITITVLDIYTLSTVEVIRRSEHSPSVAITLVQAGYLGTAPESPSLAISLKTLELFRVIRLHRPSFSIKAFAKTICYLYTIPYRRHYRSALSDAFDIYLSLRRIVDKRVRVFLDRDKPHYRVLNACPPCNYELEGEPELRYKRMFVLDGNNSLKRIKGVGNRQVSSTRPFEDSDYYLSTEFVNKYANEVKARATPLSEANDEEAEEGTIVPTAGGDPTDGSSGLSSCSGV